MNDQQKTTEGLWSALDDRLIEFTQDYVDGYQVIKRGLEASPMVIKKFDIHSDEVMAFTNEQSRNAALTAFHFHPNFPVDARRAYMEDHDEGHTLVAKAAKRRRAERAKIRNRWERRVTRIGRGVSVALSAVAIQFAAGGPAPR